MSPSQVLNALARRLDQILPQEFGDFTKAVRSRAINALMTGAVAAVRVATDNPATLRGGSGGGGNRIHIESRDPGPYENQDF